jgi:hypothetical protein
MEYFCEKTVEVLEDHIIIHQAGEVARTERKATLDDIFRRFGTDEMKWEWFKDTKVS